MRLDPSQRRRLWVQNQLFTGLFALVIGLSAWLSVRYSLQFDWTAQGRNTLSVASQRLLTQLNQPIHITAYVREQPTLRAAVARLVGRYQRHKPDMTLAFLNPDLLPERARALAISQEVELYIDYRGRSEKLQQLNEQALSHTLQRLIRPEREALFLTGHGERKPLGAANHDLGSFGRELEKVGLHPLPLELGQPAQVPATTAVLVLAGPRLPPTAETVAALVAYVQRGGALLWLREPDEPATLQPLAAALGVTLLPGVVVDADAPSLGIKNPAFIPIADYGPHPVTAALRAPALLPQAAALAVQPDAGWVAEVLLESQSRSWTETGPLDGPLRFATDGTEHAGPLPVGVALTRPSPGTDLASQPSATSQQRIIVLGDGDFLSNTYLGNGANLELGLAIFNWLAWDDAPLVIPLSATPDAKLDLSPALLAFIAALFLLGLPLLLLVSGWLIWFWRRRR